jgi:hypothetical protein
MTATAHVPSKLSLFRELPNFLLHASIPLEVGREYPLLWR